MLTTEAIRLIGATRAQVIGAIRNGKLKPPGKDSGGRFIWTAEDIERARKAIGLDRRRREDRHGTLVTQ